MKDQEITLTTAVEIDGKQVKKISIREPKAGELRELSVLDVVLLKATAITTLTPRISVLTERHMANMGAADLLVIGVAIADFFAPAS
jgi:hypothetical protein